MQKLIITNVRDQGRGSRSLDLMPEHATNSHGISFTPGQVAVLRVDGEDPAYFAFAGDTVELLEVVGHGFELDLQVGRDLVFVAMGIGVAPLRSALRHVLTRRKDFGKLVVLYGARTPDDFCYQDEIESWEDAGVELRQVISRPDGHDWSGPTGYVQSLLDHVLPDLPSPVALICGSLEMLQQTRERLEQMGFGKDEILTNY